jgi:hypothetical protein
MKVFYNRVWRIFAFAMLAAILLFTLASQAHVVRADSTGVLTQRVVQVALESHEKVSQYTQINSTASGYGKNACGLVAAAAAVGGEHWVDVVDLIADVAGNNYHKDLGIQPSKYVFALKDVFGTENVREMNDATLTDIYDALAAGHIVIVDVKVNPNRNGPSATRPNFAHFARVLGMDMGKREIYLENTLRGSAYWTVTFDEFLKAWESPETTSSMIPDPRNAEPVTQWAVVLNKELLSDFSNDL